MVHLEGKWGTLSFSPSFLDIGSHVRINASANCGHGLRFASQKLALTGHGVGGRPGGPLGCLMLQTFSTWARFMRTSFILNTCLPGQTFLTLVHLRGFLLKLSAPHKLCLVPCPCPRRCRMQHKGKVRPDLLLQLGPHPGHDEVRCLAIKSCSQCCFGALCTAGLVLRIQISSFTWP